MANFLNIQELNSGNIHTLRVQYSGTMTLSLVAGAYAGAPPAIPSVAGQRLNVSIIKERIELDGPGYFVHSDADQYLHVLQNNASTLGNWTDYVSVVKKV
jgi:hypothetical protein